MHRHHFLRLLTAGLAGLVLFAPDDGAGDGAAGDGTGDAGAGDGAASTDAGTGNTPPPEGKLMTQAEIDRLVTAANARGKASGEAAVKAYLEAQSQSAEDQAKTAATTAQQERDAAKREALEARVEVALERALLAAKVPVEHVAAGARLTDLDLETLAPDGKVDTEAVKALAASTIAANPFLVAGVTPPPGQSGGEHGGSGDETIWTKQAIAAAVKDGSYAKHEPEIKRQLKAGLITA